MTPAVAHPVTYDPCCGSSSDLWPLLWLIQWLVTRVFIHHTLLNHAVEGKGSSCTAPSSWLSSYRAVITRLLYRGGHRGVCKRHLHPRGACIPLVGSWICPCYNQSVLWISNVFDLWHCHPSITTHSRNLCRFRSLHSSTHKSQQSNHM